MAEPDRNLALELVRATEAAAIRAVPFIGKGDKLGADGAAVDAMRAFLATVAFDGAGTRLLLDGDVAGGINAARYETRIDMCIGTGGSPEGVVTACAIKALGGFIEGRLAPKDDEERRRGEAAGLDIDRIYDAEGL